MKRFILLKVIYVVVFLMVSHQVFGYGDVFFQTGASGALGGGARLGFGISDFIIAGEFQQATYELPNENINMDLTALGLSVIYMFDTNKLFKVLVTFFPLIEAKHNSEEVGGQGGKIAVGGLRIPPTWDIRLYCMAGFQFLFIDEMQTFPETSIMFDIFYEIGVDF